MGPIRNPNWSTSGMRVTLSYLIVPMYCMSLTWSVKVLWSFDVHRESIDINTGKVEDITSKVLPLLSLHG
jgi:membrane protein YdbS with pleckstrin-like domain